MSDELKAFLEKQVALFGYEEAPMTQGRFALFLKELLEVIEK